MVYSETHKAADFMFFIRAEVGVQKELWTSTWP